MLSCIVGKTEVTSFKCEDKELRKWSSEHKLKCPVCGEELKYYNGEHMVAHFKHLPNSECSGNEYAEKDTQEHNKGKIALYDWLSNQEGVEDLKIEKWIPETKQRADIYFKYKNKEYVIEYQCTNSTNIKERTQLYELNDINVIWVLGIDNFDDVNDLDRKFKALEIDIKRLYGTLMYFDGEYFHILNNFKPELRYISYDMWIPYKTKFNYKYNSIAINDIHIENLIHDKVEKFDAFDYMYKEISKINNFIVNPNTEKIKFGLSSSGEEWKIHWEHFNYRENFSFDINLNGKISEFNKDDFSVIINDLYNKATHINERYKIETDCDYITSSIQSHIDDPNYKISSSIYGNLFTLYLEINNVKIEVIKEDVNSILDKSMFKMKSYQLVKLYIDKIEELIKYLKDLEIELNGYKITIGSLSYMNRIVVLIDNKDHNIELMLNISNYDIKNSNLKDSVYDDINKSMKLIDYIDSNFKFKDIDITKYVDHYDVEYKNKTIHLVSCELSDINKEELKQIDEINNQVKIEDLKHMVKESFDFIINKIEDNTNFKISTFNNGYGTLLFTSTNILVNLNKLTITYGNMKHKFKVDEDVYKVMDDIISLSVRNIIYNNIIEI